MNADVHALAGAYALDALPPEEASDFAAHLADCAACQQEVAELQVTAAQLGLTVAQAPPPALREQVLRAARQTRQVPPATRPAPVPRRRTWPRVVAAAAAAVVVAGAGLLGVRAAFDEPTPPDLIAAVIQHDDAETTTADLRGGGTLTVIRSGELGRAVVLGDDLPPIGAQRVYQLWLVDREGNARSADVLIEGADAGGQGRLVRDVRPGDRIAITREPAGGSEQPTMRPLGVVAST
jgi:anti-sigma-K factor RskA